MRPSFPPARPSGAPDSPVRDTQPSAPPPEALRTAALAPDLSRQMKTQPGLRATLKMDGAPFESRPTRDTSEPPASVMRASWTRRALFTLSVAVACGAAAYVTTLWVKGRFESETDVEEDESLVVSVDAPPPATSTVLVVDKDRDTDPAVGVSCNPGSSGRLRGLSLVSSTRDPPRLPWPSARHRVGPPVEEGHQARLAGESPSPPRKRATVRRTFRSDLLKRSGSSRYSACSH